MDFKYDFTVVIPVYNGERYLEEAIKSVLKQDYDLNKIQLVIVNDGSKDNSLEIMKKYEAKYENIKVINQKNAGVSSARNKGIKNALGKYILFLDADDYLSINVCKEIYPFFEENYKKIDLVSYAMKYDDYGKIKEHFRYGKLYDSKNTIYDIKKKPELIQTTINYCVKNLGKETLIFDHTMTYSEDEAYATRTILQKGKLGHCPNCTYYYRRHQLNANATYTIVLKVFKKYTKVYKELLEENKDSKYIINLVLNTLRWRIEEGKLIPYTEKKALKKKMLSSIYELLEYISVEDIMALSYLKTRTRLVLLELKKIPYEVKVNSNKVVVQINEKKYSYNNKIIINITNISKKRIEGNIIKSFNLLDGISSENLKLEKACLYKDLMVDTVYEYNFSILQKSFDFNSIFKNKEFTCKIKEKAKSKFFYKAKVKDGEITVEKKPLMHILKTSIKKVIKKLKVISLAKKIVRKLKKSLQKLRRSTYIIAYKHYSKKYPLNKNKVLFLSASRDSLTGNFEFVYNELKKNESLEIQTILKKNLKIKTTLREKIYLAKMMAQSKFILLDDFYPIIYPIKLRKGTELIQLWHAMGAFKTVGYSRMGKVGGPSVKSLTHKNYTATIVSSEKIRENYAEAFGISVDKVHALGVPRTDIFFDENYKEKITKKLKKKYPFIKGKKVILFAPTFRGNGQNTAYYEYKWLDFAKIKEELKEEYVFLVKMHPFIKNKPTENFIDNEFYFDVTKEREINDLLFITDCLITDYSSVIFEYSFFKKPVVFFIPDYKEYVQTRDFYYPFSSYMYGSTATNTKTLLEKIKEGKVDEKKIKKFNEFFCSACDGNSTKKVVEELIMKKKDQ